MERGRFARFAVCGVLGLNGLTVALAAGGPGGALPNTFRQATPLPGSTSESILAQQQRVSQMVQALGVWKAEVYGYDNKGNRTFEARGTREVVETNGSYFSTLKAETSDGKALIERTESRYDIPFGNDEIRPYDLVVKILEASGPQFGGLEPMRFLTEASDSPSHLLTESRFSFGSSGRKTVELSLSPDERITVSWTLIFGALGDFTLTHLRRSNSCRGADGGAAECAFTERSKETAEDVLYGTWAGKVMSFIDNGVLLDEGRVFWTGFQAPGEDEPFTFQESYVGSTSLTVTETVVSGSADRQLDLQTSVVHMRGQSPFPFFNGQSTLVDLGTHLTLQAIEYREDTRLDLIGVAHQLELSDARVRVHLTFDELRKPYLMTIAMEQPVQ
jgi:hypothetical protein